MEEKNILGFGFTGESTGNEHADRKNCSFNPHTDLQLNSVQQGKEQEAQGTGDTVVPRAPLCLPGTHHCFQLEPKAT